MFDACFHAQQIKCLTVINENTRECLAIDVAGSIRSRRVIDVLAHLGSERVAPLHLRSDNGAELVCYAILEWIADAQIRKAHIHPHEPWQNGTDES